MAALCGLAACDHWLQNTPVRGHVCSAARPGDFWHARGSLPVEPLNAVLRVLRNWTRPTLMLVGNHDQVRHLWSADRLTSMPCPSGHVLLRFCTLSPPESLSTVAMVSYPFFAPGMLHVRCECYRCVSWKAHWSQAEGACVASCPHCISARVRILQVSIGGLEHALTSIAVASPLIHVFDAPTAFLDALWLPYRRDKKQLEAAVAAAGPVNAVFAHADVVRAKPREVLSQIRSLSVKDNQAKSGAIS